MARATTIQFADEDLYRWLQAEALRQTQASGRHVSMSRIVATALYGYRDRQEQERVSDC